MVSCQASCALQLRTAYVDVPRKDCDAGLSQQAAITFDQVSGESSRWHLSTDWVNQRPGLEPTEAVRDHALLKRAAAPSRALPSSQPAPPCTPGLWLILGCGIGLALLWLSADKGLKWYRRRKQRATAPADAHASGSEGGSASPHTPERRQSPQQPGHSFMDRYRASFRDHKTVFARQVRMER